MSKHIGSCLCQKVRYEVTGDFTKFFLCHCSRCRKETGSAHAANLFSTEARLSWLSGQEHVKTFRLPDSRFSKSFCVHCGSALLTFHSESKVLLVPAGSLDSEIETPPTAHIFMASKANWDEHLETVPKREAFL